MTQEQKKVEKIEISFLFSNVPTNLFGLNFQVRDKRKYFE